MEHAGLEITPFILSLTGFGEVEAIRRALDASLEQSGKYSVGTVAETIFPDSLYKYCSEDASELYSQYLSNLPRLKKIDKRNARGTYFERLIDYQSNEQYINQLDIIISSLVEPSSNRRSKLQASIFDPTKDHSNEPYQSFPCLQHITFYKSSNGGLIMNSFYAIQYIFQRAYGNWLGLINLGKFIARESDMELECVNFFVGIQKLDHLKKSEAKKLLNQMNLEH